MLFFCFSLFRKEESEHHENVSDTQLTFLSLSIAFFSVLLLLGEGFEFRSCYLS